MDSRSTSFKMSTKAITLYRVRIILTATILSFICGLIMAFFTKFAIILSIAVFVLLAVAFFWYPTLLFKNYSVTITDDSLYVTKGVILLRSYCTHITNICYIGKVTTPLQRLLGIFSLCLYTRSGKIHLSNLENIPDIFRKFTDE